jgi:hypothetical protein
MLRNLAGTVDGIFTTVEDVVQTVLFRCALVHAAGGIGPLTLDQEMEQARVKVSLFLLDKEQL